MQLDTAPWHRLQGNALKREGGGSHASTVWASVFGAAAPASAQVAPVAPLPRPAAGSAPEGEVST